MRRSLAFAFALLLVVIVAGPASAAPVPVRTFKASFGTYGTAKLSVLTESAGGQLVWALKGLKPSVTYKATVYRGSCSRIGTAVATVAYVKTSTKGAVAATGALSYAKTDLVWQANWTNTLVMKLTRTGFSKCSPMSFKHVTRVRMSTQGVLSSGIDLPVVRGPNGYPYCNVAMYSGSLAQPAEPINWATFVYAHARKGMFLPLWNEWHAGTLRTLIGKVFYLYTSDNRMYKYVIDGYSTGLTTEMQKAFAAGYDKAWLQTSTGPNYTYKKLFIKGTLVSVTTVTYAAAHPTPHIVKCG